MKCISCQREQGAVVAQWFFLKENMFEKLFNLPEFISSCRLI